ncbi:MAG: hypothetical protein ABR875_02715 [Minisyncoccia bacterium]|jgi:hypothetical protein
MPTKVVEQIVNLSDEEFENEILKLFDGVPHQRVGEVRKYLKEKRIGTSIEELQATLLVMLQKKKIAMFPGVHIDSEGYHSIEGYIEKPGRFQ